MKRACPLKEHNYRAEMAKGTFTDRKGRRWVKYRIVCTECGRPRHLGWLKRSADR